jgi:hypothetical protein
MKKIIAAGILMIGACINTYGQAASNLTSKKLPPSTQTFGPYTVTIDDGKVTVTKNANYDASKALKRDTTTAHYRGGIFEVYTANSTVPTIKKDLIYDVNSVSSERLMSKQERMTKYNSRAGVLLVHLKPGVIPVKEVDLLKKFNISPKNYNLPVYVDYKSKPDDLLAIPNAVLKIETVTDADGFRFLNITTKEWDAERLKYAGQQMIYIR